MDEKYSEGREIMMWLGWCGEGGREGGLSLCIKLTGESSVGPSNQGWILDTRPLAALNNVISLWIS